MEKIPKISEYMIATNDCGAMHFRIYGFFEACRALGNGYEESLFMTAEQFGYAKSSVQNVISLYRKHFEAAETTPPSGV